MLLEPIGMINTPFKNLEQMPIQPKGAANTTATITLLPELTQGLVDIEGFSHLYLIYHFHHAARCELTVTPFLDTKEHGVFSTRSPLRPSHIGLSICKLLSVQDNVLSIEGIDVLDGTPLLDIKPYIPQFDLVKEPVTTGWMQKDDKDVVNHRSDSRFV